MGMLAPCPQPHPKPERYKLHHYSDRDRKNLSGTGHSGVLWKCCSGDFTVAVWIMGNISMHAGPRGWGKVEESTQKSGPSNLGEEHPCSGPSTSSCWVTAVTEADSFAERQLLHPAHTPPSPGTLGCQVQYLPWCSMNLHSTTCFRCLVSAPLWGIREDKHFTCVLTVYQRKTWGSLPASKLTRTLCILLGACTFCFDSEQNTSN